jgi:D-arabinan exo alpha-(1,3)/(1,5)-arabinofuranosidase (non-reducing end)
VLSGLWDVRTERHGRPRSISAENFDGGKGQGGRASTGTGAEAARHLGQGWKVSPSIHLPATSKVDLAQIGGPGVVKHIWVTTTGSWRELVLRMSWDGAAEPAVEVPLGDFFCNGWDRFSPVNSLPVVAAPYRGFNSYWEMPFRTSARISLENLGHEQVVVYYQIDYVEREVDETSGYFHAHWRRENPLAEPGLYEILDCPGGPGVYCGIYLAVGVNSPGWWGEGELKFFLDGDVEFPTICGTGTEDYFGGAWDFDVPGQGYTTFSAPFIGLNQVVRPDGLYGSQQRFGMYRWHIADPIAFESALRVTVQDLGWHRDRRYLKRRDDIASTAFWYHRDPVCLPGRQLALDDLEVG